jgi:curli biogenesis system outer membrane secretion channel CsgG
MKPFINKSLLPLSLVILSLAFSGCSTVTEQTVNKPAEVKPQVSKTLTQTDKLLLKRKVAIARFSNETTHGNSFLLDSHNDRVGKQAMDILSARLTETGKFIMLERSDLNKINKERDLSNLSQKVIGADYLIIGSVSQFGRESSSEVGIFSRNRKQVAHATVNIRLVNVKTGQIVYSEEGSGKAESEANTVFGVGEKSGYDSSLDDKALSAAISKVISNLIENLMNKPWHSYLLGEQNNLYIMAGGKSEGIQIGDIFAVTTQGKVVKNPQTGMDIQLPGDKLATIKVVSSTGTGENEVSFCSLESGSLKGLSLSSLLVKENK